MIVLIEIAFAIWMLHALASVAIGLAQMFLGLAASMASWALLALSKVIECLWRTAWGEE